MSSKRSKITGLLSKGFKPDKCKTSIGIAVARMKVMRNKRDVQVKQVRREVAKLLEAGDESTARIRVDHVIRDEKTVSAYELLSVYCELIVQRLHIIDSQKICPIDLKEAIASVVFAAPRCADVPELLDVAKHFQAKYGKEFITAALELRPGSGVGQLVVDKLSANSANIETKVKVLKSIADENNVKWEAKGFEEKEKTPQAVRLEGSSKFLSATEAATVQPALFQAPPPATNYQPQNTQYNTGYQPTGPNNYTPQDNTVYQPTGTNNCTPQYNPAYQPTGPNNSSSGISDPPLAPPAQAVRSQSGSRHSESKYESEAEAKRTPPHLPDHDTEYTTVEEAAEAAAKSAEIASKAAKAAASMARSGSISREQSDISSKSYSSRDAPRKHEMEEVSSKPETNRTPSMQTNTPRHAKGAQAGPSRPAPDRSPVAPPSPPSHSRTSSSSDGELAEATTSLTSRKSPEYSKQTKVVQEEEEEHDYYFNTGYHSNSRGSTTFQGVWDDNGDDDKPEVSSNIRFDSSGVFFDDSTRETNNTTVYEEESFSRFEREKSSGSKGGISRLSSDNFSSPKLPKSGSMHNNDSSLLFTSNTSEWDPPRSQADKGSGSKFDKGPRSPSRNSLFNDDKPSLLSVLSGRGPSQLNADEDSGPKFDSGPNFDSDVLFDDENDKLDVHVEEEKVAEEEYFVGSSLSPLSDAKEKTRDTLVSSTDESRTKKIPQSRRNRDRRRNPSEMVQPDITKEPKAKAEKAPLHYTPKENSSDDDLETQQVLDYNMVMGGFRNRRPSYMVKPSSEEPKPSNTSVTAKPVADFSVEEERLYTRNRSNNGESDKVDGKRTDNFRNESIYSSTIGKVSVPRYDNARKDLYSEAPELDDSGENSYDWMNRRSKREPPADLSSRVSKDYTGPVADKLDNPKPLPRVSRRTKEAYDVRKNSPFRDNTTGGDELSEREEPPRRIALRYTPNRRNFDGDEEEEVQEELSKPAKIKVKVPNSSRVSNYLDLDDNDEAEEEVAKLAKIKLKEPSSSGVSKGCSGMGENELDYQEPLKSNRRVVGSGGRDSRPTRATKEEPEVRKEYPIERTKKVTPSKSSESRTPRGPLQYAPTQEDSDEEEQVRNKLPKESPKSSTVRGSKEKVDMKEKKEEKPSTSVELDKKQGGVQPTFPPASFPLDMDALRARVQHIKATMKDS